MIAAFLVQMEKMKNPWATKWIDVRLHELQFFYLWLVSSMTFSQYFYDWVTDAIALSIQKWHYWPNLWGHPACDVHLYQFNKFDCFNCAINIISLAAFRTPHRIQRNSIKTADSIQSYVSHKYIIVIYITQTVSTMWIQLSIFCCSIVFIVLSSEFVISIDATPIFENFLLCIHVPSYHISSSSEWNSILFSLDFECCIIVRGRCHCIFVLSYIEEMLPITLEHHCEATRWNSISRPQFIFIFIFITPCT